jgi:carbon storage regulator CsrA
VILTLKEDEQISIGDQVKILVVRIKGKQVKFGINTPYNISVIRDDSKDILKR